MFTKNVSYSFIHATACVLDLLQSYEYSQRRTFLAHKNNATMLRDTAMLLQDELIKQPSNYTNR